ncbi:MAG: DUF5667 domain-containing protein [Patescibacteria group bacterium]
MIRSDQQKKTTDFGVLFNRALEDRMTDAQAQQLKSAMLDAYRNVASKQLSGGDPRLPMEENIYGSFLSAVNKLILKPMIPIIIAIALIVTGTGTAIAADQAKPGDTLYPVDRAIEHVSYNFAVSEASKADMLVQFAAEREKEHAALIIAGRTKDALHATEDTKQALQKAAEVIERVQAEHQESNQTQAAQSLNSVEEKLNEIQNRFTERQREEVKNRVKNALGEVEAEATIRNGQTTVKLKYNGQEFRYTLSTTDINSIIASVQERTGLSSADVKALLKTDTEDTDTASDEAENLINTNTVNTNLNANTNPTNVNANKNLNYEYNNNYNYSYNGNTNGSESQEEPADNSNNGQGDQNQNRNRNEAGD